MTISVFLMGGLGNQLFQIFAVIAYAKRIDATFVFKNVKNTYGCTYRETYWDTFLSNLKSYLVDNIRFKSYGEINPYRMNDIPTPTENLILEGYFQSYKYFDKEFSYIRNLIQLDEQQHMVKYEFNHYTLGKPSIALHFRLGDYAQSDRLPLTYYEKALACFSGQFKILCFGEEMSKDIITTNIEKLQELYPAFEFELVDYKIPDWKQLLIMSLCDNNIIANSSFSFMGAYFNGSLTKKVVFPQTLLPERPEDWIKIDC
jgi:hypothetical protein